MADRGIATKAPEHHTTIDKWFRNDRAPSDRFRPAIADFFAWTPDVAQYAWNLIAAGDADRVA